MLATVVGQDLEEDGSGTFRIARKVATDRVISTVDPEARHGHKTQARSFDGYKGHVAMDPDSEIITDTAVTPGNAGDAAVAENLISDLLGDDPETAADDVGNDAEAERSEDRAASPEGGEGDGDEVPTVYGDNAYGTGEFQSRLEDEGIESKCKTQKPNATNGLFSKERFTVDLDDDTVTCPAGVTVSIRRHSDGGGIAKFAEACASCALRVQCTKAKEGRSIAVGPNEAVLARARARQKHPDWVADYRATRPKVERKIAHLMRRKHGGRRARVRGRVKAAADFSLLAAAVNLARLGALDVYSAPSGWIPAGA
ncbi:MAG: transposase [Actinomycetota bacterium]|nr:transposase [Actinomycetota bacterium]